MAQKPVWPTCNHLTCACDVMIRDQSQQAELSEPLVDPELHQEATEAAAGAAAFDSELLNSELQAGTFQSGQLH